MKIPYERAVDYLYRIPKFTKKNGLEHTKELVKRLQIEEKSFKIIHVAGSNGKGSVCSAINEILVRGNKHTGMFVSPHLVKMEERFCIDGTPCTTKLFLEAFEQVYREVEKMQQEGLAHPSFFEYLFAMGMFIFKKEQVEYLVLETGLGGRLDCTNIIEHPILTIITSISLEHTEYLGNTLKEIAGEKAGIIKSGVPIIYDASEEEVAAVICKTAREKAAKTYGILPKSLKVSEINRKNIDFYYRCGYDGNTRISIPFAAPYQMMNMALAYQAMTLISCHTQLYKEAILEGISHTKWPGRMQEVQNNIYFDGAHNVAGIRVFLEAVNRMNPKNPILLFSMVKDKDYEKAIGLLAKENWKNIYVTTIPDERGISAKELAAVFMEHGRIAIAIENCEEAYHAAREDKAKGQTLFCTGSLYFIGELLKLTGGNKND